MLDRRKCWPLALTGAIACTAGSASLAFAQATVTSETYPRALKAGQNMTFWDLVAFGQRIGRVVVLGGYSGQGYDDQNRLHDYLAAIVAQSGANTLYVAGGTADGIGLAYRLIPELARSHGLANVHTAGIVSRNAITTGGIAPEVEANVFVATAPDDWNVRDHDGRSLMVEIARRTGGRLVYLQGGAVSAAELREAVQAGVPAVLVRDPALKPDRSRIAARVARNNPDIAKESASFSGVVDAAMAQADAPMAALEREAPAGLTIVRSLAEFTGTALPADHK